MFQVHIWASVSISENTDDHNGKLMVLEITTEFGQEIGQEFSPRVTNFLLISTVTIKKGYNRNEGEWKLKIFQTRYCCSRYLYSLKRRNFARLRIA